MFTVQPDEAQRGRYNDGYSNYNPYEQQQQQQQQPYQSGLQDPYITHSPPPPPNLYPPPNQNQYQPITHDLYASRMSYHPQSPPPVTLHDPYSSAPAPVHSPPLPLPVHSPPPMQALPQQDYLSTPYNPQPLQTPSSHYPSRYDVYDDHENDLGDAGDLPLLRAPSQHSQVSLDPAFPGGFAEPVDDDQDTNIRYGRIPQRVPRRYKTIKKVEYVAALLTALPRAVH